jgi:hypothetical protein
VGFPDVGKTFLAMAGLVLYSAVAYAGEDEIFRSGFDPPPAILVQTPQIVVAAGDEQTYCYYFRAPAGGPLGVHRWHSGMAAGMHHLLLFATYDSSGNPIERQPPGTLTQSPCGIGDGGGIAAWLYAAHSPDQQLVFPADDGGGLPLAVEIGPNQPMFVQMHLLNPGTTALTTSAVVEGEAVAAATSYTKTATYLATNVSFSIPPAATGYSVERTCAVPVGARFWWFSTRTHHFAVQSKIRDGGSDLVVSNDWEHPAQYTPPGPAYFQFPPSGLTYQCTYDNPGPVTITSGESETMNEACIGIGYFFPATRAMFCINDVGPL